jgi:hypothetical protein
MNAVCGTYVVENKTLTEFWWGKPEGKKPLQRPTWKSGHTIKKKRSYGNRKDGCSICI